MERRGIPIRLIIAGVVALFTVFSYYSKMQVNPVTGEKQHISLSVEEEIALGLNSAPSMANEFGGLYQDARVQDLIDQIGQRLVSSSDAKSSTYKFDFHVLADPNTVNAFALPGGQIFITVALLSQLKTEDEIAGVLGHEIGHVIGRHSAEHMAKQELTQGLVGAAQVASDPTSMGGAQMAAYIGNMVNMKFGRDDELESDDFGVKYMIQAGYNPEGLLRVMEVLAKASGGNRQSEFMSTHPAPENRAAKIKEAIAKYSTK